MSSVLQWVTRRLRRLAAFCRSEWRVVATIGPIAAMGLAVVRWNTYQRGRSVGDWQIQLPRWRSPVKGRYGTSDLEVFMQIFVREEHAWVRALTPKASGMLILDCGANVGYASIFFLRLFPRAMVIAIEPDAENFAVLRENLESYETHVKLLRAGVWSHKIPLDFGLQPFRDGKHWSRQVREAVGDSGGEVLSVTIPELLSASGYDRIALLKVDIEGAEAIVFTGNCHDWLASTDAIAVELHDDTHYGHASDIFHHAIRGQGYQLGRRGELTIAVRPSSCSSQPFLHWCTQPALIADR